MTKNKTNKMDKNCADVFNKTNFLCQKYKTINKQIECYTEHYLCGKMSHSVYKDILERLNHEKNKIIAKFGL